MGKVTHWKLCKTFKFDHMNKWCMHNPESIRENEMHKIPFDFEIQTDHLISARQPDLVIVSKKKKKKKKKLPNSELWRPSRPQNNKESEKRDKYLDLARELQKSMVHEGDGYANWCARYSQQRIGTETGGLENKGTRGDHPN